MLNFKNLNKTACWISVLPLLMFNSAGANGKTTGIEEIIVTATKRGATTIKDTALSIRAIGGDVLNDKGVQDFTDWAPLVPGLIAEDQGPGERRYVIRGVRSVGPSTVGVYLDDAVISGFNTEDDGGGRNVDIRLYDVERVEVLRGPQGTLYGAGSLSGTIRYVTNKPDTESLYGKISGSVSSTKSGEASYKGNGFINLPVTENFAVRAVGWYEDEGGFIDNVRLGIDDVNSAETDGGRLSARWRASKNLQFDASVIFQDMELGGKQRFFPQVGDLQSDEYIRDAYDDEAKIYQASLTYELGYGSIHASTAYFDRNVLYRFDSTPVLLLFGVPLPFAIAVTDQYENRELWSNEIRFASDFDGPLQLVAGAYYSSLDRSVEYRVISADSNGVPSGSQADIFGRVEDYTIDEMALFTELSYDITERLQAIVGLRWYDFEQDTQARETLPFGGFVGGMAPPPDPARSASDSDVSVKLSLSYKASDAWTFYGLYAEGFRQGGTNSIGFGTLVSFPESFESDSVKNYELGAKALLWDDRLSINTSVYVIDWSDMQTIEQEPVQGFSYIGNTGSAQIDGLEVEVFVQPSAQWELAFSATVLDARLTEDQPAVNLGTPVGRDGDPIPYVPDYTLAASVQYNFAEKNNWSGFVRADWNYVDSSQTQFNSNGLFYREQDSYEILDLRLTTHYNALEASLFVDNVFDERAEVSVLETIAIPLSVFTNRPRTFGLSVGYRF